MCVAIYKPKSIQAPSLETLKKCWEANPDGAGFAMLTGDDKYAIQIHKGYMTWEGFENAFKKYGLANFSGDLLLHFRIATHGGISAGNTHPFPLVEDTQLLQHTNLLSNFALIHNGILPIKPAERGISDTMELCKRLAPLQNTIKPVLDIFQDLIGGNKVAVMTRDEIHMIGKWECIDGVYFSNVLWDWSCGFSYSDAVVDVEDAEYELLEMGYCPYCETTIHHDQAGYYCCACNMEWSLRPASSRGYQLQGVS